MHRLGVVGAAWGTSMTGYELHDLLSDSRELISDTWYYFLTVHLAVFGIVHITSRRVSLFERLMLLIAYGGFLYLNFRAQTDNYLAHIRITDQIKAMAGDPSQGVAQALLPAGDTLWVVEWLPHLYGSVAALSLIIIFSTHFNRADE